MLQHVAMDRVATQLTDEGLLTPEEEGQILQHAAPDAPETPWYIRAFIGGTAWLSAMLLVAFLGMAGFIDGGVATMIIGGVFIVTALVVATWQGDSIFWGQLAFAVSLAGQVLLVGGIFSETRSVAITALSMMGVESLLFFLYPDSVHRLISLLGIVAALLALLMEWELQEGVHLLIWVLALASVLLWEYVARIWSSRWSTYHSPLGYGAPLALLGICILSLIDAYEADLWWISALGLALVLLYLGYRVLVELDIHVRGLGGLWLLGAVALLCIPAYQTPGILAAIIVLVVGFWRGNLLLMGLATAFLAGFLITYYYNLDVTLLVKSYILLGTGGLLLALRVVWLRLTAHAEEQTEGGEA